MFSIFLFPTAQKGKRDFSSVYINATSNKTGRGNAECVCVSIILFIKINVKKVIFFSPFNSMERQKGKRVLMPPFQDK